LKVLIVGSGAREHTLAWKFSRSKRISGLFIAPGNAGTEELGDNLPDVDPSDPESITAAAIAHGVTHVVIGPEVPLAAGAVNALSEAGIKAIGPDSSSARLESSKQFSKAFMRRNKVPTAESVEITSISVLQKELAARKGKVVLKKSGLAAGKGVLESDDPSELKSFAERVLEDDSLILEEFLTGFEISVFALLDGNSYRLLPPCADFKKAGAGDSGPNTGGMGSICPVPTITGSIMAEIERLAVVPTMEGLKNEGLMYTGVLYFGLMMTEEGPKVLEYNVRFGDPEAQVLLPLIENDFGNLIDAMCTGSLQDFPLRISEHSCLGVVIASEGYPGEYPTGVPVTSLPASLDREAVVFHAATLKNGNGFVTTGGGRCFTAVGFGSSLLSARARAYAAASEVKFQGAWYRPDIGKKFFFDGE
jgi:phosphoribosylamine---glycine ligase